MPTPVLPPAVRGVYFIAFTVRSGSNLLSDYLKHNGFGEPAEHFQYPFGQTNLWCYEQVGADARSFADFVPKLLSGCSRNGVFGSKLAWTHRNVLEAALATEFPFAGSLEEAFANPLWVRVVRRDKVAQAVSLWRAWHSNEWLRRADAGAAAPASDARPPYTYDGVLNALSRVIVEEAFWDDYFVRRGVRPVQVVYEELLANPAATLFRVMDAIQQRFGVTLVPSPAAVAVRTDLERQRDEYSREVRERFLADAASVDVPGRCPSLRERPTRWDRVWSAVTAFGRRGVPDRRSA